MSWVTWSYEESEQAREELEELIAALMRETALEMDSPALDDWFDAGIEIEGDPGGGESICVFHELQETEWTDINGRMKPGFTLTLQLSDGQQETETFFSDERGQWPDIAEYFSRLVVYGDGIV